MVDRCGKEFQGLKEHYYVFNKNGDGMCLLCNRPYEGVYP